ncbi:unnamed protein product [Protopolystoma xenopodis]|uniref:Uncharacterized protein n=1 Tax=Protopolystoma xenopodis TaxID=117903 RepID=A0A3S5CPC8_9PLAT|nr:unnamed protein product [Protopolystoma xenopodis]
MLMQADKRMLSGYLQASAAKVSQEGRLNSRVLWHSRWDGYPLAKLLLLFQNGLEQIHMNAHRQSNKQTKDSRLRGQEDRGLRRSETQYTIQ